MVPDPIPRRSIAGPTGRAVWHFPALARLIRAEFDLRSQRQFHSARQFDFPLAPTFLADIPASDLAPGGEGIWGRLKAYWQDGATWRGIAYLLARFPIGLFTFVVAVTTFSIALGLIGAPILAAIDPMELGIWQPDTWYEGMALVPLGLAALVASGWISEGLGAMSRSLARWGAR